MEREGHYKYYNGNGDDRLCDNDVGVDDIAVSLSLAAIEEYLETESLAAVDVTKPLDLDDNHDEGNLSVPIQLAHDRTKKERSLDVQLTGEERDVTFLELGLRDSTVLGLKKCGFKVPSPIQLKAIPLGKFGYDLILQAKSGTGKTCAFGVIILEQLDMANHGDHIQALILAPTREIACQNADVVKAIGSLTFGLCVKSFIGGTSVDQSIKRSKICNIASGSPGRILHMITAGEMDLSHLQVVVLDEADKLMEFPFISDVNAIFKALPAEKQVIAASATYPEGLKSFVKTFMNHPMEIAVDVSPTLLAVSLYAADVHKILNKPKKASKEEIFGVKMEVVLAMLNSFKFTQAIVFCRCLVVDKVYEILTEHGFDVGKLSSTLDQRCRLIALRDIQQGKCRILVSSDLGARGIDCEGVDVVINFEPPEDVVTFVHRCGRAGRFGSKGICVTLTTFGTDYYNLAQFSRSMRFDIRVFQTLQQIKDMGHGKEVKLERMRVKGLHMNLSHPDNENYKEMFNFLVNCKVKYPCLQLDKFAGYKLNVDVDSIYKDVEDIKRRHNHLV